jgi:membrane protein
MIRPPGYCRVVSHMERVLRGADRWQQRHRRLAFGIAAWKKFSDDQAGNLAALIAYYAFASIFPW